MVSSVQVQEPVSRTDQYKRVMKPLLERKRRARINRCLDELRDLLVAALQAEGETVTRLEKADILELTVRHVRRLNSRRRLTIPASQPSPDPRHDVLKFQQGFVAAAQQVQNFLVSTSALEPSTSSRLLSHLTNCASNITTPPAPHPPAPIPALKAPIPHIQVPTSSHQAYSLPRPNNQLIQHAQPPKTSPPISPPPLMDLRVKQEPYVPPQPMRHPSHVVVPTPLREPMQLPQDLSIRRPPVKEEPKPVQMNVQRYREVNAPVAAPRPLQDESKDAWRPW